MRVERLNNFQDFSSVREEWNSLAARSNPACISMTHEWLCSWWEAFGTDADLWVTLLWEGNSLMGAAPLMLRSDAFRGLPARSLTLMVNGHTPEGGIMLAQPEAEMARGLLDYLQGARREWDVLALNKLPEASAITSELEGLAGNAGLFHVRRDSMNSPYIDVKGNWDTYYAGRSSKLRKVLRNKLNRVEKNGAITIAKISDAATIRRLLGDMFRVSAKSWKAREGRSISDDPRAERFYRSITDVMGEKGMVDLWLMRHGEQAIAFEYHVRLGSVTHPIRADFDEEYRHLSPGSVLEYHILKNLFEDPEVHGYNSCGDTYDYLVKWATDLRRHVDLQLFSSKPYSRNLFLLESKMVPIARKARDFFKNEAAG